MHFDLNMKLKLSLIILVAALLVVGCGSKSETAGYSKEDFKKTDPPAGYLKNVPKGPGTSPPPGNQAGN